MTSVASINGLCAPALVLSGSAARIIGKVRQTDDHTSLNAPFLAVRGRVEDWRADIRLRWVFQRFRGGPQSGCHHQVSSPRRIERSVRFSRSEWDRAHLMRETQTRKFAIPMAV